MLALYLGCYLCPFLATVVYRYHIRVWGFSVTPQDHPSSLMGQERSSALGDRALLESCKQETGSSPKGGARAGCPVLHRSFLSSGYCVFCVTLCPESPKLPPAAIWQTAKPKAISTHVYPSLEVPMYFLVSVFLSRLLVTQWHSIVSPSSVTPVCAMLQLRRCCWSACLWYNGAMWFSYYSVSG